MKVKSIDTDRYYLESLIKQRDWKALIRYWMAHVLEPEGLDCAINILSKSTQTKKEHALAEFFSLIRNVSPTSWPSPDEALLATCDEDELVTIALVCVLPTVFLCHAALKGHVALREEREDDLRQGLSSAVQCLNVSERISDSALQQLYNDYIAAALWKLGLPTEALAPMLSATDLVRTLRKRELLYYGEVLIGSLGNLAILYKDLNLIGEAAACYREAAEVCLSLGDYDKEKLQQAAQSLQQLGKIQKTQNKLVRHTYRLKKSSPSICKKG